MTRGRVLVAEALDHLAADDPAARQSRRDLVRVHRAMGTRAIVARAWQSLLPLDQAPQPLRVLEIGAGDGSLLLAVASQLAPTLPRVQLTLLDRQRLVTQDTLTAYARLGWTARVEVTDVLDWAARATAKTPADAGQPWHLITAHLFLHHFQGAALAALLGAIAARAHRFFACEPRRHWLALAGSHLVGALGANEVTRGDAVASVHAGFRGREISEMWPGPPRAWQCREYPAGLFSHGFCASRRVAA